MVADQKTESIVKRDADFLAHGLENAFYMGAPGDMSLHPVMECMCGFSTGRCLSWCAAGRALDVHLASVGVA
jgi:hypothetical protein